MNGWLAGRIHALHTHRLACKGRDIFRHGIVDRELSLVDQHHRREACDRFGHGEKSELRIDRHGLAGLDVAHAKGLEIDWPTVLLNHHDRAGQPTCRDFGFEEIGEETEFFGRWWGDARRGYTTAYDSKGQQRGNEA